MNKDMEDYYKSPEWQRKRLEAMQWADFRCQLCNAKDKQLHVHHRTYDTFRNEPPNDLVVLCEDCHAKFHGKARKPKGPSIDTEFGWAVFDAIAWLPQETASLADYRKNPELVLALPEDVFKAHAMRELITYAMACMGTSDTITRDGIEKVHGYFREIILSCMERIWELGLEWSTAEEETGG